MCTPKNFAIVGGASANIYLRTQLEELLAEKIVNFKSTDLLQKMHALYIPAALVKTVNEVFEEEAAKKLIREEIIDDVPTKRVTGTVFKITS